MQPPWRLAQAGEWPVVNPLEPVQDDLGPHMDGTARVGSEWRGLVEGVLLLPAWPCARWLDQACQRPG